MKQDDQIIIFVACFIFGIITICGVITYYQIIEVQKDFDSFKASSCDEQKKLIEKYQFSSQRDMTDENDYYLSECVLHNNSYQENQQRIKQNNEILMQGLPYLIFFFGLMFFVLFYVVPKYNKLGEKEREIIDKKNQEDSKIIVKKYDAMPDLTSQKNTKVVDK